jgi:phospholipid-binding lipoprotein MlaA
MISAAPSPKPLGIGDDLPRTAAAARIGPLKLLHCRMSVLLGVIGLLLSAFPAMAEEPDPTLEQFNRAMYDFNKKYYSGGGSNQFLSETIPEGLRRGMTNFFANMGEPVVAVSSLALGDVDNASIATRRFFYNLFWGYGGVVDRATEAGVKSIPRDMGQALCHSGLPDGPFLVLPFYGPSTVGDFFGSVLPVVAGYVALGEAFWVYRASSKVAAYIDDKDGGDEAAADGATPAEATTAEAKAPVKADKDTAKAEPSPSEQAADAARRERAYHMTKERYLAARELVCPHRDDTPAAAEPLTPHRDDSPPVPAAPSAPVTGAVLASVPGGDSAPPVPSVQAPSGESNGTSNSASDKAGSSAAGPAGSPAGSVE